MEYFCATYIQGVTSVHQYSASAFTQPMYYLFLLQLRRHGAQVSAGQADRRHLLAVGRARHRAARPRHRLQLLAHLPPEPEGGQEEGAEGRNTLLYSEVHISLWRIV